MTRPNLSTLFRDAHALAKRLQGQRHIACSYREAFADALRRVYAAERAAVARRAEMDAFVAEMKADAANMIRANLERRHAEARTARIIAENNDTIGGHRLIAAARNAERAAADALRLAA